MKFLLSMSLIVSVFVYADDHNDEKTAIILLGVATIVGIYWYF